MEGFIIRGWEIILPGCGGTSTLARGATVAARSLDEPQPISNQPVGLGFPHLARRYRPRGSPFSSPGIWICRCMEGFIVKGWETILPGCAGSMYDPQPISDRPARLGFPHHAGRFRPGGSPFSYPGCRSCKDMEGFLIRGCETILPGVRWLYVQSPAHQRSGSGAEVSTPCGTVLTQGITVFVPGLWDLWMYGGISDPGMRPCRPRVALDLFSSPSQSAIGRRGWGFHAVRGGVDPGDHRFRPRIVGVVDVWRDF